MQRSATLRAQKTLPLFDDELLSPVAEGRARLGKTPASALPDTFLPSIRTFKDFGTSTEEVEEGGILYLINEFWTAGQRQAHSIHEISYRACFKPQLPEFFIRRLTEAGDAVHDPFMGRGTTPVQAALMGRRPVGNDINPLSVLLTRPRLTPPTAVQVTHRLRVVPWERGEIERKDLLVFYHPDTLRRICALRRWLFERAPLDVTAPDPVDDWIRMVALNRLTGHSPGFFSVYTLPPNQAVSVESQTRINANRNQIPPFRDVAAIINKKTRSLLKDGGAPQHPPAILGIGAASASAFIPDGSVSLVVTSPPFLDIVQYAADNWLRCWFAGIDVNTVAIGMHRTETAWMDMVRETLTEQARIVRPGGHVAFEVGEVRNGKILLERLVWQAAEGLPFERQAVLVNQQEFTKTANCWGVSNNTSGTNTNRIVVFRRTPPA
ncbi:MAG: site-specific DNA-methyltransferase [Acetobacteraceae bacterium]|nr:site-specific DNA-methyltransferase [Acetobacteraceae bacterium]